MPSLPLSTPLLSYSQKKYGKTDEKNKYKIQTREGKNTPAIPVRTPRSLSVPSGSRTPQRTSPSCSLRNPPARVRTVKEWSTPSKLSLPLFRIPAGSLPISQHRSLVAVSTKIAPWFLTCPGDQSVSQSVASSASDKSANALPPCRRNLERIRTVAHPPAGRLPNASDEKTNDTHMPSPPSVDGFGSLLSSGFLRQAEGSIISPQNCGVTSGRVAPASTRIFRMSSCTRLLLPMMARVETR